MHQEPCALKAFVHFVVLLLNLEVCSHNQQDPKITESLRLTKNCDKLLEKHPHQ